MQINQLFKQREQMLEAQLTQQYNILQNYIELFGKNSIINNLATKPVLFLSKEGHLSICFSVENESFNKCTKTNVTINTSRVLFPLQI